MSVMDILPLSASAVTAQSQRLNTVASNLANADSSAGPDGTPYRARHVVFQAMAMEAGPGQRRSAPGDGSVGVGVVNVVEDTTPAARLFDPSNPLADDEGYVTQSNVNVVEQMVDMMAASRAYQSNLEVMNTAQQLAMKIIGMGA